MRVLHNYTAAIVVGVTLAFSAAVAQSASPALIGIGDSLGEGVQSDNAFRESQPNTYLNRFATQLGVAFPQPLLSTSIVASINSDSGRSRLSPDTYPADLAVSGATTANVLTATASTGTPTTEADLVLPPYFGLSQIQIAEQVKPQWLVGWVGTDDLISEVLTFDALGSQSGVTPLATFTTEYQELVSKLKSIGAKVVMANIPDLTKIAYLFDNDDLTRYTGTNYNLPSGYVTSFPTMVLLELGVFDGTILKDPNYVLSPAQLTAIQQQIQQYNQVIQQTVAGAGFPVVDAYDLLDNLVENPITIGGITITNHYNGGAFSLDGVHPSDTGHAIFANAFIAAADKAYDQSFPQISPSGLVTILDADPFIDFGGNGIVAGRPFTGLLETLGPLLGLSGSKLEPSARPTAAEFMRQYDLATGRNPNQAYTKQDVINAVKEMLGLR